MFVVTERACCVYDAAMQHHGSRALPLGAHALSIGLLIASATGCSTITEQFSSGGVSVLVDDAHGIPVGGPVRVHGVTVGRITEVTLEAEGARIAIEGLPDVVELKSDACGAVRTHGVANDMYLEIDSGHADEPLSGTSLTTCARPSIEQAGTESIAELTGLVRDLRAYVAQLESGARPLCAITQAAPAPTPEIAAPLAPAPTETAPTETAP